MHMEFVIVGKASSDKIHVKYNDKIATFHGEIGIDYFLVLANKIEWYPNKKATINEKIELMTIANKTFLGEKRLYFIADDAIWFDWKGSPLIVIENNIIKSIKISCYNVPLVKTQMKKIIVTAKSLYSHPKNVSKIYAA